MKVLYFMNHVDQGGAALALYDLVAELKQDFDIEMVVFTGKRNTLNDKFDSIAVENHVAHYKNFMSSAHSPRWLWKFLYKVRHAIYLPFAVYKIEKEVNVEEFDVIHSNLDRIDIGAIIAKKYKKPHLWHIREHGVGDFELISTEKNVVQYMETFNSRYIVISKSVKKMWENNGLPCNKIDLIYDGIRADRLKPDINPHSGIVKILFLGGYDTAKGQGILLEAIIKLPKQYKNKIMVDFFGNGEKKYKNKLQEIVDRNCLNDIIHLNEYNSNVYEIMNQYDIGVNCSKCEGFGRVTVEYMLAGLCPIASNTGANSELIENEKTGVLFEYWNINSLIEKLTFLIDNPTVIREYGLNASKHAREAFSMKKHSALIYNEYVEVSKGM